MKRGKRYVEAAKLVDRASLYGAADAISIVKKAAGAKFDETVELHIRTGCDGRHADQQIRGAVVLPHGTGKTVRILVFAKGPKAEEAQAAGADFVGAEELIPKIQNEGWLDFDVVVATPDMMGVVGRLGRVLGPKGLMPNPTAVDLYTEKNSALRIHGSLPKLFRVHLAQTFITLDLIVVVTANLSQNRIQLIIAVCIPDTLILLDLIKRRLCQIYMSFPDQIRHKTIQERQKQGTDMSTVHIGIGHDNDLVVTKF